MRDLDDDRPLAEQLADDPAGGDGAWWFAELRSVLADARERARRAGR